MGNVIPWGTQAGSGLKESHSTEGTPARAGAEPAVADGFHTPSRSPRIGPSSLESRPPLALAPSRPVAASVSVAGPNDEFRMNAGQNLFRGDDNFYSQRGGAREAQFFLVDEAATKIYGDIRLKYTLRQPVTLLRVDQDVEHFRQWLSRHRPDGLEILHTHYGYPRDGETGEPRQRDSVGDQDRKLLSCIHDYSQSRIAQGQRGYDGYFTDHMKSADMARPEFHPEVGLCHPGVVSKPAVVSHQLPEELDALSQRALGIRMGKELKRKRQENRRDRIDDQADHEPATKRLRFSSPLTSSPRPWPGNRHRDD